MLLSVAIVLLVSVAALDASGDAECRCFPDQMSGESFRNGKKMTDYFVDYTKNKVFVKIENFKVEILQDLDTLERYLFRSDGSCSISEESDAGPYEQCVPSSAQKTESEDSITYHYMLGGATMERTVAKYTCVLKKHVKTVTSGRKVRTLAMSYKSVSNVPRADVFDVDIGHCTQRTR